MVLTVILVLICGFGTVPAGLVKGLEDLEIRRQVNNPDYRFVNIVQNTEMNSTYCSIFAAI